MPVLSTILNPALRKNRVKIGRGPDTLRLGLNKDQTVHVLDSVHVFEAGYTLSNDLPLQQARLKTWARIVMEEWDHEHEIKTMVVFKRNSKFVYIKMSDIMDQEQKVSIEENFIFTKILIDVRLEVTFVPTSERIKIKPLRMA